MIALLLIRFEILSGNALMILGGWFELTLIQVGVSLGIFWCID